MPRLLAVEWDSREARVAVAADRGNRVLLEQAFAVELSGREAGKTLSAQQVGRQVADALQARQIRRGEALVAVGRAGIELKRLSLPPAPEDELPELVRFQALREFHSLGEDWPLDFIPLGGGMEEARTVLAAAISPELVGQIQETCQAAALKPQRLVLRPVAAAALLLRHPQGRREGVRLLVDPLPEEADLTVLADDGVVFVRTARLPLAAEDGDGYRPLLGELRRTLAAANNQLAGRRVEAIYLCGSPQKQAPLVARIQQELNLPAYVFDPLDVVDVDPQLARQMPEHIGRFAPLLGTLIDELFERPPAIDFLHPRRRPAPPSRRGRYIAAAAIVAGVLVLGGLTVWMRLAALDRRIEELARTSVGLEGMVAEARQMSQSTAEIEKWLAGDVLWLDELERLSRRLPGAQDVMVTQLRLASAPGGGTIQLDGLVRQAAIVDQLEQQLRDESHGVEGRGRQQSPKTGAYGWQFRSTVTVKK